MCTWKLETPLTVPAGARISAGKSGIVDKSLPNGAHRGESITRELHPIAGVSCEPDHQAMENFGTVLTSHLRFDRVGHLVPSLPPSGHVAGTSVDVHPHRRRAVRIGTCCSSSWPIVRAGGGDVQAQRQDRAPRRRAARAGSGGGRPAVAFLVGTPRRVGSASGGRRYSSTRPTPTSHARRARRRRWSNGLAATSGQGSSGDVAGPAATCSNGPPSPSSGWCSAWSAANCVRARSTA